MSNDPDKKKPTAPDDKPNEMYVGNGQAVVGAPRGAGPGNARPGSSADPVASLFDKARDARKDPSAAKDGDSDDDMGRQTSSGAFAGAGRRLGFQPDVPSLPVDDGRPVLVSIRVTFYRNGFTVDDGPLLATDSGEGRMILEAFDRGIVPDVISAKHPRRAKFDVALVNKKEEDYVRQWAAFDGAGRSLGGAGTGAVAAAGGAAGRGAASAIPAVPITVQANEPRGRLVLQLPDGTRHRVEVNPARHTVADLFGQAAVTAGVSTARIQLSIREGAGRTTPLAASTEQTLQAAKCDGAAVFVNIVG